MDIVWGFKTEETIEIELLCSGKQEVAPPHDLGHSHQRVVDHHGKLIGPSSVCTSDYKIAAVVREVAALASENTVCEGDGLVRDIEPGGIWPVGERGGISVGETVGTAGALIDDASVRLMRSLRRHDVGACAGTGVGQPRAVQPFKIVGIDFSAPTLAVRAVKPAVVQPSFVPVEAEPEEVVLNPAGVVKFRALRVKVFDTQNPFASRLSCGQPREEGGEDVAEVHTPGRRRSETPDYGLLRFVGLCF